MAKLNLGRVAFVLRGEWAQGAYNKLDVVSYATTGDSYVSRVDNNTALPTDDTKWLRLTNVGDSVTAANQAAQAANTAAANATAAAASGVRTDRDQGLNDTQKATARGNIDAASVGEVSDLKSALSSNQTTTKNLNTVNLGRWQTNENTGVISQGSDKMLGINEYIAVDENTNYTLTFYNTNNIYGTKYISFYNSEKGFIERLSVPGNIPFGTFRTPTGCRYVVFNMYTSTSISLDGGAVAQLEKGNLSTDYIRPITMLDAVSREVADTVASMLITFPEIEESDGYFSASGGIQGADVTNQEKYTQKFDLHIYNDLIVTIKYSQERAMWCRLVTYDANGDFIRASIFVNKTAEEYKARFIPQDGDEYVAFSYRTFGENNVLSISSQLKSFDFMATAAIHQADVEATAERAKASSLLNTPFRFKPCYDHLFVSTPKEYMTVPHESKFHVRLSKSFGFDVIEANTKTTSDGVFVVNHFVNGKFGNYFSHVDGTTDISDTAVSSVTWDWIKQNVRYNSRIPQYRVRPLRLEEFLRECKQNDLIPMVGVSGDGVIDIADSYMGKDNYIAYGATREQSPYGTIYAWQSATTKESIVKICEKYGAPFIYGMSNPSSFSDSELLEIIDAVHERGCLIATAYCDNLWYKYSAMGFDAFAAIRHVNRLTHGNICNYHSMYGFSDFTYTNATENNGVLTFSADGTLSPNIQETTYDVCVFDLEIEFVGTISFSNKGEYIGQTITSDGETPFFMAVPVIHGNPKLNIAVTSGTIIKDLKYKASVI